MFAGGPTRSTSRRARRSRRSRASTRRADHARAQPQLPASRPTRPAPTTWMACRSRSIRTSADIFARIDKGELDGSMTDSPPAVVTQKYLRRRALKKYFHSDAINQGENITMNLDVPPFTDIHVRKAVAWVLDKSSMLDRARRQLALHARRTHIIPPTLLGGLPASYDPYTTPNEAGDLGQGPGRDEAVRRSTRTRTASATPRSCKNLVFINTPPFNAIDPVVQADLAKIGIEIVPRDLSVDHRVHRAVHDQEPRRRCRRSAAGMPTTRARTASRSRTSGSTAMSGPVAVLQLLADGAHQGTGEEVRRAVSGRRHPQCRRPDRQVRGDRLRRRQEHVLGELRQVHDDQGDGVGARTSGAATSSSPGRP